MNPIILNETNTFCINLESNRERWNKMEEKFNRLNMKVTRWNASNGKDNQDPFYECLNDGQKGCSQSHINIWRHIVENNLEYALILEDDACFDKDWKNKLEKFNKDIGKKNWDCILLSSSEPVYPLNTWTVASWQYSTIGYIISIKGAKWMLEKYKDCFDRSDSMTLDLQTQGNCYTHFPWLVIQDGKDTTIGSNVDSDNKKMLTNLDNIKYSLDNYII